ncbi:MAG: ribosome silencing factor [Calditrichaeota bacterium]|nr:MAG: ribosome silencing factor [Calditrichota bacterium]
MTSQELSQKIASLAYQKKGKDIVILDLRGLTDVTDFFVIISGESDIHVKTLANYIEKELRDLNIRSWHTEGLTQLRWVLLDFIEVVVHIFRPEIREYYNLEKLWADAKIIRVEENAEDRIIPETTN